MEKDTSSSPVRTGRKNTGRRSRDVGHLKTIHQQQCKLVIGEDGVIIVRRALLFKERVTFKLCKGTEIVLYNDTRIHFTAYGEPVIDLTNLAEYSVEGIFQGVQSQNVAQGIRERFRRIWEYPLFDDPPARKTVDNDDGGGF